MNPKYSPDRRARIFAVVRPRHADFEDERDVIEMNGACLVVSGQVQGCSSRIAAMIDGAGRPTGGSEIPAKRRTTMLKTISSALLAVSVLAAPAFAATGKTAPVIKPTAAKTSVLNANNARMGKQHETYVRHHR